MLSQSHESAADAPAPAPAPVLAPIGERVSSAELFADAALLGRLIGKSVASIDGVVSMAGAGGQSGEMTRLRVTLADSEGGGALSMVVKTTKPNGSDQSAKLGLAREAYFFGSEISARFREATGGALPHVYYCYGDVALGEKTIVFEDLGDAIQLGYFFGGGSPLNWGKDLAALTAAAAPDFDAQAATRAAFSAFARLHAGNWNDRGLVQHAYLRGADWFQQQGEASFLAAQQQGAACWAKTKPAIEQGTTKVKWAPELVAIIDASFARVSWTAFQERLRATPFTLVHADSHPANMMWRAATQRLVLLDFEVVGLGSGPQDLSQFLISHMASATRRACEHDLVRGYYAELTANGVSADEYSWDACWAEYQRGGSERWVWLVALLSAMCPAPMVQFWHDQLLEFMQDHGITAASVGMPRV